MHHFMLTGASAVVIAIIASQNPATAQDTVGAGASSSPAAAPDNEIVVTAQRVAQPLQKVPVAVQVISGNALNERKINDLNQMQLASPSLFGGQDNNFALRGVGSMVFSPNVDTSVGIAIDDVSLGLPTYMNIFAFEDVSQVEVLTGPQGLLFGRNASAGLVNVVTQRPVIGELTGRIYAEQDYRDSLPGGKWGAVLKGTLNIPLSPIAALRINALYSDQDPLTDTVARTNEGKFEPYQRRAGVKAKLLIEPSDRLSFYLIGDYAEQHGIGGNYDRTARSYGAGSLTQPFAALDGITAGPGNFLNGTSSLFQDYRSGGMSANIAYQVSDRLTLSNIAAYRGVRYGGNYDSDFTSYDGNDQNTLNIHYNQYSDELRLALKPGALIDGQTGLYYFGSRQQATSQVGGAGFGLLGASNSFTSPIFGQDLAGSLNNDSFAAFGQANIHPTTRLTVILGGRVTHDRLHHLLLQNQQTYPIPLGPEAYSSDQVVKHTDVSWKGGLQYQVTPLIMAYATYGKGYKGPTFNDSASYAGQSLSVGPEVVHSLDVGIKSTLFDHKAHLNIAAFREIFDGIQVQGFDSTTSSYYTANGANAKSQGVEIQFDARPVKRVSINASATILDARFTRFMDDHCYPGQTTCAVDGSTNSSGHRLPGSARFTSTVAGSYTLPLRGGSSLVLSSDYYHRSSTNFSSNANPQTGLGAIDLLGASLGVNVADRFNVTLFCKNCTNKVFPVGIATDNVDGVLAGINTTIQNFGYNSVRTIGISASASF